MAGAARKIPVVTPTMAKKSLRSRLEKPKCRFIAAFDIFRKHPASFFSFLVFFVPSTVSPPINLTPTWRSELAASRAPVALKIPAERPSASSVLSDGRSSQRGKQIVTRGRGVVECTFVFPDPLPSSKLPPPPQPPPHTSSL